MAKTQTDFYAKTTRSMLSCVKEVGAMPFILFEYYLTWQTASDGIRPPLQTVADDLGLEKNAVCNLRTKLIQAGWIRYENEQVFILKSFTKNESNHSQKMNEKQAKRSQKMNNHSQKMNEPFTKNEQSFTKNESPIYKEENKQRINNKKEQREEKTRTREDYTTRLINFIEEQKNTLAGLSKSWEWQRVFETAFEKQVEASEVEKCYLLLEKEKLLNGKNYQITYEMMSTWILNVGQLEKKVEALENGNSSRLPTKNGYRDKREVSAERQENGYALVAALRANPPEADRSGQVLLGNGSGNNPEKH